MAKARKLNFRDTDLILDPFNPEPDVAESIDQTIAYNEGFDPTYPGWRALLVDALGRLFSNTAPQFTAMPTITNQAVTTGLVTIFTFNTKRQELWIYNYSGPAALVTFYNPPLITVGTIRVMTGSQLLVRNFQGRVDAQTVAGTANLNFYEV